MTAELQIVAEICQLAIDVAAQLRLEGQVLVSPTDGWSLVASSHPSEEFRPMPICLRALMRFMERVLLLPLLLSRTVDAD